MNTKPTTGLAVAITCDRLGQAPLTRELVGAADLSAVRYETWLAGLRAGALTPEVDDLVCDVRPGDPLAGGMLADYAIELTAGQCRFGRRYTVQSVEQAARRGTKRLYRQKILAADDRVHYYLTASPDGQPAAKGGNGRRAGPGVRVKIKSQPLVFEPAPLAEFMAASQVLRDRAAPLAPVEEDRQAHLPIFLDAEVWEEGRALARRGGDLESAAVWTGRLMRDVESPEVFLLVEAVIEAQFAKETTYSVQFSGDTWHGLRELLEQRRRRLNRPHERMVGSVHGHNFYPDSNEKGQRACATCEQLATCKQSTAVASSLDEEWHQTIFSTAPWAAMGIWGWTARQEEVWQLYTLAAGILAPRTARIISPGALARLTATTTKKGGPRE